MKLITTKELAKELNLHPETVRRMARRNQIPFIRVSETEFRFNLAEVLDRLQNEGKK
ncbi:hypothetical protein [Vibrio phage LP.1]|nr:hypothetical protein [Vibrio phage LP.1]